MSREKHNWLRKRYPALKAFKLTTGYGGQQLLVRSLSNGLIQQVTLGGMDRIMNDEMKLQYVLVIGFSCGHVSVRIPELIALQERFESRFFERHFDSLSTNFTSHAPERLPRNVVLAKEADIEDNAAFLEQYVSDTISCADYFTSLEAIYRDVESGQTNSVDLMRILFKILVKAPDFQQSVDYKLWNLDLQIEGLEFKLDRFRRNETLIGSPMRWERNMTEDIQVYSESKATLQSLRVEMTEVWERAIPLWKSPDRYLIGNYATGDMLVVTSKILEAPKRIADYQKTIENARWQWPKSDQEAAAAVQRAKEWLEGEKIQDEWNRIALERLRALSVDAGKEDKAPPKYSPAVG